MDKTVKDNEEEDQLNIKIHELISFWGGEPETFEGELVTQLIQTSLKLIGHDIGQLKLMTRSFKEMRYAYRIFSKYIGKRRISIFGSARTPEDHPDYQAAKKFSSLISEKNWMCITGAANGIMKAGLEGAESHARFGLSIRLPFEVPSNSIIAGDPKLITFRYFFTRKLMFLSHSDAVAAFPGGYGTQDELFEVLTLIQTGKANIIPIVLIEAPKGSYWRNWLSYVKKNLLKHQWISLEDLNLFYIAPTVQKGVDHIMNFYRRYHSSRYVKDTLVIRLLEPLSEVQIDWLNQKYAHIIKSGKISQGESLSVETDHLELPRLFFEHTRHHYGDVRALIDDINKF